MQGEDVILHNIFTQSLPGPLNNKSYKTYLAKWDQVDGADRC